MIHWKLPVMHTHTPHIENGKNYMAESALNRTYIVHIQFTTRISKSQRMCAFLTCPRLLPQNAHILTCRVFRWFVLSRFLFLSLCCSLLCFGLILSIINSSASIIIIIIITNSPITSHADSHSMRHWLWSSLPPSPSLFSSQSRIHNPGT